MAEDCNGNTSNSDEEQPDVREDGIGDATDLIPLYHTNNICRPRPFVETQEWKWTREACEALFQSMAKYYNELWFPTVLLEWCLLYYRSNYHDNDYWGRRECWLEGDSEIRMAVWGEVLKCYSQRDHMILSSSKKQTKCRLLKEQSKVCKMYENLDKANDTIIMKRMTMEDAAKCRGRPLPRPLTAEEKEKKHREKLELSLANPDVDPNWVEMRRRMRGSMAAFNIARCNMSQSILKHLMFELCLYWDRLPPLGDHVEACMERNIVREIKTFRNQLFGECAFTKIDQEDDQQQFMDANPELFRNQCPEPDNECSPEPTPCPSPCPAPCSPAPCSPAPCSPAPCSPAPRSPAPCGPTPCPAPGPAPCPTAGPSGAGPSGAGPSGAGPSRRPKRKTSGCRPPATNKLVEARAKQVAQRMRDRENRDNR